MTADGVIATPGMLVYRRCVGISGPVLLTAAIAGARSQLVTPHARVLAWVPIDGDPAVGDWRLWCDLLTDWYADQANVPAK